jgi:hypothetical protein
LAQLTKRYLSNPINMKLHFFLFLFIFLLSSSVVFSQDSNKIFELKGRIDVMGNTTIEIIPANSKSYSRKDIMEINSIIGRANGKSVDVLNILSNEGFKLISALYVCDDRSNNFNGNFLVYYLTKLDVKNG